MIKNEELSLEKAIKLYIPEYPKNPAEILATICSCNINSLWELEELHYYELLK